MKLRKEEERAHKRIKDLDRRQKFVSDMHDLKNNKINMINTHYNTQKFVENTNRDKFNDRRRVQTNNIVKNLNSVSNRNKSQVTSVKGEQKMNEKNIFSDRQ